MTTRLVNDLRDPPESDVHPWNQLGTLKNPQLDPKMRKIGPVVQKLALANILYEAELF